MWKTEEVWTGILQGDQKFRMVKLGLFEYIPTHKKTTSEGDLKSWTPHYPAC